MKNILPILVPAMLLILIPASRIFSHCDGLDGPVVLAAEKAIASGDVSLVLIWVQKSDEAQMKKSFEETLAVRKLSPEGRRLADMNFFETLVRLHRAGEGAGFTGLKPAGRDLGPAIPVADKALRDGNVEPLVKLLTTTIQDRVRDHFNEALTKQKFAKDDLDAGRAFVNAYVEYIHCVETLYETATHPTHGHYDDTGKGASHQDRVRNFSAEKAPTETRQERTK
jgi:hypothetical protein